MKTYPARFIDDFGEIEYNKDFINQIPNIGDVATFLMRPTLRYLLIRCACGQDTCIPLNENNDPGGWKITSKDPINIEPSIKTWHNHETLEQNDWVCHYFVHNGELQMLDDSTTPNVSN